MKYLLAVFVTIAIAAGSAYAGCGKKDTDSGKLASYDKESKSIVVETADGKTKSLTLTPETKSKDADGEEVKIEKLIGTSVTVVSEHSQVDSVTAAES